MTTSAQPNATRGDGAGIPFQITQAMRRKLREGGYMDEAIRNMTPQAAHELLRANGKADDKPMVEHALALAAEGRAVFPLNPLIDPGPGATDEEREKAGKAAKAPRRGLIGGHKNATVNTAQILAWWAESPQSNIGVACTRHPVVDLDPRHGGHETFAALSHEQKESLLRAPRTKTPGGGVHFGPFTLPDDAEPLRTGTDRLGPGLDMPSYVVGPGSVINGRRYERIHDAPMTACPAWIREAAGDARRAKPRPAAERLAPSPELVREAVERIPNDDVDWDAYNAMLMAIWAASEGEDIESAHLWAAKSCKYVPADVDARWEHYGASSPPTEVGWSNLLERARRADPTWHMVTSGFEAVDIAPLTLELAAKILGAPEAPTEEDARDAPTEEEEARKNSAPGLGVWDAAGDEALPPPRGWLLGHTFARKFMSSILADGGVGKTALRYAQALSLASGRMLTGEHVFQRSRVLIVSLEDDADELRRRILAARLHHRIDREALKGWLFLSAPGGAAGKLMSTDDKGRAVVGELAANIEAAIVQHNIDLVMLDPFVKAHSVEENKNSIVDDVAQVLTDLATKHDIAVDAPHHVSKGPADPGNANRSRGASAMVNAGRLVYTLTVMNSEEAKTFGVPEEDRKSYVRVDSGKVNIAKGGGAARWFRLVGVRLGNKTALYPNGDEVQTVEPWTPPETWGGLSADRLNRILDTIDAGLPDGNRYTDGRSATTRAAWRVVVDQVPSKSEGQAREIIKTWVKNGVLVPCDYDDPVNRRAVRGLKVDPGKRPK
jgi:AAA domain/Bifunctional DNA primase/polymerase, N-terminal/Primase C terminal 2 (PriCT-2)